MSSTGGQPPLTRRQVRDLERAREAGEAITGSISIVSGSPVPSNMPVTSPAPASTSAPASTPAPASVQAPAPGSAPYSDLNGPTRRELRAQRAAAEPVDRGPVPLKAPQPDESGRDLSEALSHAADFERAVKPGSHAAAPTPAAANGAPSPAAAPTPASAAGQAPESILPVTSPAAAASPASSPSVASSEATADVPPSRDTADESVPGPRRRGGAARPPAEPSAPASATPPPSSTPTVFPFVLSGSSPSSAPSVGAVAAPVESLPASVPAPAPDAPASQAPASTAPAAFAPTPSGPAVQGAPSPEPRSSIPASIPEPTGYVPPTGHWSTQAAADDALDTAGSHFGTATGQQNALILNDDSLPDVTGALNATGEVIITGSIDLPRSLAATGSHHAQRIDGADIDRMLEEGDRESADSDASPVRASRAVSANTSTRAVVLAAGKPKSNRLPIIAGICGVVVIVVIVVLVVVGFARGIL
jgi:hypothetical protein